MKRGIAALAAVAVLVASWFALSPRFALAGFRSALESGDTASLEGRVDFPRLREDLKAQLHASLLDRADPELSQGLLGALAMGFASTLAEGMLDALVTPASLAAFARGLGPGTARPDPDGAGARRPLFENARIEREALDRFSVRVPRQDGGPDARFVFHRQGLRWRLTSIQLPVEERD